MAFTGDVITVAGFAKFELPGHTLRLCDGGVLTWAGETYAGEDATFGVIEGIEPPDESLGDSAPGGKLTMLPKDAAAATTLSQPTYQNSRMRFWFAEIDRATGAVTGTPVLCADMRLDTTNLRLGYTKGGGGYRKLDIEFITSADRLMLTEDGNVLSPAFHKRIWPGELGLDNANGQQLTVAWGVAGPPRGSVSVGSSGGGATFGGDSNGMVRSVSA